MQTIEVFKPQEFTSNSDGSARVVLSSPIPAALAAKTFKLYLWLASVDSNTKVEVYWAHSADGVNWYAESTAILDSGTAASGMYVADPGSTIFGAYVRFGIQVSDTSATALKKATASLQAVFKPN